MQSKQKLTSLVEAAVMVALGWVLDFLCSLIPFDALLPFGGSISLGVVPVVYYSYRRGPIWGLGAGLVYAGIQMLMSFYVPPAGTFGALLICILLDYVVAYGVIGLAELFSRPFGKHRLVGYAFGAALVNLVRLVCGVLSGVTIWTDYVPEGMGVWEYSLAYNAGYMIPNAILTAVAVVLLARLADPHTLRPMRREA